jgi:nitrous oxide reductase accessory protein NosL
MKIRAKANGDVIDVLDDAATMLLEAGIYERVEEEQPAPKTPAQKKSTKVAPMTTDDMPGPTRKAK